MADSVPLNRPAPPRDPGRREPSDPHANDGFYAGLPPNDIPVSELMGDERRFARVPQDWHVVLTDVKGSTQALSNGRYHLVNLVATGSIIAALNISRAAGIRIPFFFGGDGATMIVPDCLVIPILQALNTHRGNARRNFGLELRVGSVPVAQVCENGHRLDIAKAKLSEAFTIPVVLGTGVQYAEKIIKGEDFATTGAQAGEAALDLEGMECRWDSLKPPEDAEEVLCLLVMFTDPARQAETCSSIMRAIESLFGTLQARNPVSVGRLRLKPTPGRLLRETRAKLGRFDAGYFIEHWLRTLFGYIYLGCVEAGRKYVREIAELSDTLVIDGRLNTVIAGTTRKRARLVESLDALEAAGRIHYGLHVCAESVMSCYVRDRSRDHIHFIDGIGGGYTQAATVLKAKLARQGPGTTR